MKETAEEIYRKESTKARKKALKAARGDAYTLNEVLELHGEDFTFYETTHIRAKVANVLTTARRFADEATERLQEGVKDEERKAGTALKERGEHKGREAEGKA